MADADDELREAFTAQRDLNRQLCNMLREQGSSLRKLAKANAKMARALARLPPPDDEPVDHNDCTSRDLVQLTKVREHHRQWAEALDFLLLRIPAGREMPAEVHDELVRVTECIRMSVLLHAPEVGR